LYQLLCWGKTGDNNLLSTQNAGRLRRAARVPGAKDEGDERFLKFQMLSLDSTRMKNASDALTG
jgi:hypothetical protein